VHATGWSRRLGVTGGGSGVVSYAGLVLLRLLADRTGLTAGLSAAPPSPLGGHHRLAARPGHPAPHLTSTNPIPPSKEGNPGAVKTPGHPARQPGHRHTPDLESSTRNRAARPSAAAISPRER
jgi:hypothetical protein